MKQSPFKSLGEIHQVWTVLEVKSHQMQNIQDVGYSCCVPWDKLVQNKKCTLEDWPVAQWSISGFILKKSLHLTQKSILQSQEE